MPYPKLNPADFSDEKYQVGPDSLNLKMSDRDFVKGIISSRGANKGRIRLSRPDLGEFIIEEQHSSFTRRFKESNAAKGCIAYVWRDVVFVVGEGQHQCLPMTSDFYLPYFVFPKETRMEIKNQLCRELHAVCDRITAKIPKEQWNGVRRWARAMGRADHVSVQFD